MLVVERPIRYEATSALDVLPDPAGNWRLEDVAAREGPWGTPPRLPRGGGRAVYWVRLRVDSRLPVETPFVLVPHPFWQQVELHVAQPTAWRTLRSGSRVVLAERPVRNATTVLPVTLPPDSPSQLYLRLESDFSGYQVPTSFALRLEPWATFLEGDLGSRHFHGIYAGLILAMVLYNLFLFFAVGDRTYLLYVLYAGSYGSIWIVRSGLPYELLWPNQPAWNEVAGFFLIAAAVACGNRFTQAFLDLPRHAPRLNQALGVMSWGAGVAALLGAAGAWSAAEPVLAYLGLGSALAYVPAGVLALRRGYPPARIFLIACSALIAASILYILAFFGALGRSLLTEYGVQIGSAAEVVLLAFALGDRINDLKRVKDETQVQYRLDLSREVLERTAELAREKARLEEARLDAEEANRRLQEANERLEQLSYLDELTGIANRRHFEAALETEWRRCGRAGQPLCLVLIDVDHFKAYNDRYGHPAGDRCLQQVAGALAAECPRAGDFVARYGGEEFIVVLPGTDRGGGVLKAERLRLVVEGLGIHHPASDAARVVTISAGVGAAWPAEGRSSGGLLAEADQALYAAKRGGRNRVVGGLDGPAGPE